MGRKLVGGILTIGLMLGAAGAAMSDHVKGDNDYTTKDGRHSGYVYATKETQAMQDDDVANPAYAWLDYGAELWDKVEGEAGKSCASCHQDASESLKNTGATFPKMHKASGKPINVEQRINMCRTENMQAKPFKYESREMLGMTIFVRNQSRGQPMSVKVNGEMKPFFEKGKAFYEQRRGLLDMACKHCHQDNAGNMIRANLLSEGMSNGFPTYRLKWQKPGSLHRRFRGCNKQVRAKPYAYGSDEYVNLELYLAWRARELPVEAPAVRN
ncbi:MAG: sulfur oxidation c-type cytochrome SoxA [Boseongicola sp.]|nr:sulfur oxidation c-type cytochrome SoxA [Boseongicola sp.]